LEEQTQQTDAIHQTKKGTIWYTTGGTAVLEITIQYIVGMGFQDQ